MYVHAGHQPPATSHQPVCCPGNKCRETMNASVDMHTNIYRIGVQQTTARDRDFGVTIGHFIDNQK
jgi:hypothetical protein